MIKLRSRLLAGSIMSLMGALYAGAAIAQDASQDALQQEPASVDEIVVTGSRIRIQDYTQSNPVVSVTSEQLTYSGITNVTDFLSGYPALVGSFNSQDSADTGGSSSAGLNLLDLRNLGTNRTLVLVNGRRHVAGSPGSAAVDTNSIPVALIERIETLTGGASAVYGADGVSGVVNFILKTDFEGVDLRAQHGWTEEGGGRNNYFSALIGQNFLNDRLNVTLGYEYDDTQEINAWDRRYTTPGLRVQLAPNPLDPRTYGGAAANDPNIYDQVLTAGVRYIDTARGGAVFTNFDTATSVGGVSFNGDGTPWNDGVYLGGFSMIGGDGTLTDDFVDQLLPGIERHAVNTTVNFEISPAINFFLEGKYTNTKTEFQAQPTFDYGILIPIDNAYMPESIRADAQTPGGFEDFVLMGRDNFDLGFTGTRIERETYRVATGINGDLNDVFNYELSYVYGRTENNSIYYNNRLNDRWFAAIDAVVDPVSGDIVCRSTIDDTAGPLEDAFTDLNSVRGFYTFTPGANSGCVPANVFGDGNISQEAIDWINQDTARRAIIEQDVVSGFIGGDSSPLFSLPAGPIGFVVGAEYRREQSRSYTSEIEALATAEDDNISWAGRGNDVIGSFNVKEAYAEVNVPILKDLPFAYNLTLDGAYRYSDYSTSGGTEAWKVGLRWNPADWLLFRGTTARAVRAPNISELFLPRSETNEILADPCDRARIQSGNEFRFANCQAALTAAGVTVPAGDWTTTVSSSIRGEIRGNPDLQPEVADTITYGMVFTPGWLPGFNFSIDYYEIDLADAINAPSAQFIVDQCYDQPQPNQFCDLIQRNSVAGSPTQGALSFFEQSILNVSNYTTSGYDFTIRYLLDPANFGWEDDIGKLQLSLVGSKLDNLTFIDDPESPNERSGYPEAPKWVAAFNATWEYKNFSANYRFTYYDETYRIAPETVAIRPDIVDPRYYNYSERRKHDISARWNVKDSFTLYGGINNFTNQEPDLGSATYPIGAQGRFFYVGATMRLGGLSALNPF